MTEAPTEDWMLPPGYVENKNVPRFDDLAIVDDLRIWQPDVYEMAKEMAIAVNALLIDVGCGSGRKLRGFPPDRLVGIDLSKQIAHCATETPSGLWIACDLEKIHPALQNLISNRTIVVCSDVVEHLESPKGLIEFLSICSDRAAATIVSTPNRDLVRGLQDRGPPANPCHVREWSLLEFEELLSSYGFKTCFSGHTREHNESETHDTLTIVATKDSDIMKICQNNPHYKLS